MSKNRLNSKQMLKLTCKEVENSKVLLLEKKNTRGVEGAEVAVGGIEEETEVVEEGIRVIITEIPNRMKDKISGLKVVKEEKDNK